MRLVGTDMSERSVGRHLCDAFHLVPGRLRPGVPRCGAGGRRARGCRRDPAAVVVRPRRAGRARRPLPDAGARVASRMRSERSNDKAETYELLHALGVTRAGVQARQRRARGRGRGARARVSGAARVLQAGLLVGLARLPDPRPDRRPRAPAAERAARVGGDAARGGGRAAAGRGRPGPARDGARDRRRADDRRDRERPRDRARASEDARGDARRPRDVLRHARGPGADARSRT